MKKMRFAPLFLTSLAFLLTTSRCTVIGVAVGHSVAEKNHAKRPSIDASWDSVIRMAEGTWVDVVKKDGKIIEGKYLEVDGDSLFSIKLDIMGSKKHKMIMLNDIDHIVVGNKSDGPKVLGAGLGIMIDGIVWAILAVAINNAISP